MSSAIVKKYKLKKNLYKISLDIFSFLFFGKIYIPKHNFPDETMHSITKITCRKLIILRIEINKRYSDKTRMTVSIGKRQYFSARRTCFKCTEEKGVSSSTQVIFLARSHDNNIFCSQVISVCSFYFLSTERQQWSAKNELQMVNNKVCTSAYLWNAITALWWDVSLYDGTLLLYDDTLSLYYDTSFKHVFQKTKWLFHF